MRSENLLFSIIALIFGFFLLLLGTALFLTAYVPFFAQSFESLLQTHTKALSIFGVSLMVFSCMILVMFCYLTRRRYFLIRMGGLKIHERVIADISLRTISMLFPDDPVDCDVIIHRKGALEILANVPYLEENQEEIFTTLERELTYALANCGIEKDFILNVSFLKSTKALKSAVHS